MKTFFYCIFLVAIFTPKLFPDTHTSIVSFLTMNIALFALVMNKISTKKILKLRIPGTIIIMAIILYSATSIGVCQIVGGDYPPFGDHLRYFSAWLLDPVFMYIIAFFLVDDSREAKKYLFITIAMFAVINLVSIASLLAGSTFLNKTIEISFVRNMHTGRFAGFSGNANQTAYAMCLIVSFLYFFYRSEKSFFLKIFCITGIFGGFISVMLSGSKGGMILLLGIFLFIIIGMKEYKISIALLLIIIAYLSISLVIEEKAFFFKAAERIDLLFEGRFKEAASGRLTTWKTLYHLFITGGMQIIFGRGFGTANLLLFRKLGIHISPHSWYFKIILEFGILGSLLWIMLLRKILIFLKQTDYQKSDKFKHFVYILILTILFGCVFSDLIRILSYLTLLVGLSFSYLYWAEQEELTV